LDKFRNEQLLEYQEYQEECNEIIQKNMTVIKEANAKIQGDDNGYDQDSDPDLNGAEQSIDDALANIKYHKEEGQLKRLKMDNQLMT
jgi:hypothetical protein